jgi:hypothetical protein
MSPTVQRLATIGTGLAVAVAGALLPKLIALIPLGTLIIGTAIPHPADRDPEVK